MPPTERERRFNMLLSADEVLMLRVLADAEGLSLSDYLRRSIHDAFKRFAKEHGKTKEEALETVRPRTPRTSQFEMEATTKQLREVNATRGRRR